MAMERNMRIGFHLLAALVLGASATAPSFARPAHWRPHHRGHLDHPARPQVSATSANHNRAGGADKLQDPGTPKARNAPEKASGNAAPNTRPVTTGQDAEQSPGSKRPEGGIKETSNGAAAKGANAPDIHMMDLGPVDTRVTVQPRRPDEKPGKVREVKRTFRLLPKGNPQTHQIAIPGPSNSVVRNAIGLPVHTTGAERTAVGGTQKSASPAEIGAAGIVRPDSRPQESVSLAAGGGGLHDPMTSMAMNHSIINGRAMGRPSMSTGAIGGAARNATGVINGTGFRVRRP